MSAVPCSFSERQPTKNTKNRVRLHRSCTQVSWRQANYQKKFHTLCSGSLTIRQGNANKRPRKVPSQHDPPPPRARPPRVRRTAQWTPKPTDDKYRTHHTRPESTHRSTAFVAGRRKQMQAGIAPPQAGGGRGGGTEQLLYSSALVECTGIAVARGRG